MIMAPTGSMFPSIIIFLLLCSMLHTITHGEYQLNLEGISAKQTICSESKVLGDRSVKIVHAYGPCSPTRWQPPAVAEMLARDLLMLAHMDERVRLLATDAANHSISVNSQLGQSASTARVPVGDNRMLGGIGYVINIFVGTPRRMMDVILDTGSDLCWIQCEPCIHCYPQHQPIFNPTTSSSLSYVPCTDPACNHHPIIRSSGDDNGCDRGRCTYQATYADGSHSYGFLVKDRVTLAGAAQQVNFTFGCGNDNQGNFFRIAGLVGLGRTNRSLNKQLSHVGANIFSYCLPPTYRDIGHLTLGDGPYPPAVYTPIVSEPAYPEKFFIDLSAMSINGRLLPVPVGVFERAKTTINTGTLLSYIPELAYTALRTAIRSRMTRYRLVPPQSPLLDTCYELGNMTKVDSPTVTFHFTGAELRLGFTQTFFNTPKQEHIYCLAFTSTHVRGVTIIGSITQRGLEVIYDLDENKIGFPTIITNCH